MTNPLRRSIGFPTVSQAAPKAQRAPLAMTAHKTHQGSHTSLHASSTGAQHMQHAFGNHATGLLLQARLTVGPAGDKYEQEADRTAQQVMRALAAPAAGRQDTAVEAQPDALAEVRRNSLLSIRNRIQSTFLGQPGALTSDASARPAAEGVSRIQRDEVKDEQPHTAPGHGMAGGPADPSVAHTIEQARGGGQPLDDGLRASMEHGFGADFGAVRVHTDSQADMLNRSLNARAFTAGSDVFFRSGEYNPASRSGQQLIAHELTHTVQQGATGVQRAPCAVQRGFFGKSRETRLAEKYHALKERISGSDKSEDPQVKDNNDVLKASIALRISSGVRSEGNRDENGHAWIELEPLTGWREKVERLSPKMSEAAQEGLTRRQWHTVGFYPSGKKRSAIFSIPGKIQEPEKPSMTQNTTATKSFALNASQSAKLFDYINSKRGAKYNFVRYNCTDFAVGALNAAGFAANEFLGAVTSSKVTSPNKVYKRLFERAVLGDKSVKIAKTLDQSQKHIKHGEENALKDVAGDQDDLLHSTQDVTAVSENAKMFSHEIHRRLKQNPKLKAQDLIGWKWMVQDFTAVDKRTLEAAYPQVFDESIDQAFSLKKQNDNFGDDVQFTEFFEDPGEENFGDNTPFTQFFDEPEQN